MSDKPIRLMTDEELQVEADNGNPLAIAYLKWEE